MLSREDLYNRPDSFGECDVCHAEDCQLWEDYDEPGEFMLCASCIRREEKARKAKEKSKTCR